MRPRPISPSRTELRLGFAFFAFIPKFMECKETETLQRGKFFKRHESCSVKAITGMRKEYRRWWEEHPSTVIKYEKAG